MKITPVKMSFHDIRVINEANVSRVTIFFYQLIDRINTVSMFIISEGQA